MMWNSDVGPIYDEKTSFHIIAVDWDGPDGPDGADPELIFLSAVTQNDPFIGPKLVFFV